MEHLKKTKNNQQNNGTLIELMTITKQASTEQWNTKKKELE